MEAWLFIVPDGNIFSPTYAADKDWLHLEARYNYEELNTFSAWFGYNISGGNHFKYAITPMAGVMTGELNGLSPGLQVDLNFHGFNMNSSSQYVFDLDDREGDFYYNWTDFSYAPLDWMWFGLSLQRTRLYNSPLEFQSGGLLGFGYRWFELGFYAYNPWTDDAYFVMNLSVSLPEP